MSEGQPPTPPSEPPELQQIREQVQTFISDVQSRIQQGEEQLVKLAQLLTAAQEALTSCEQVHSSLKERDAKHAEAIAASLKGIEESASQASTQLGAAQTSRAEAQAEREEITRIKAEATTFADAAKAQSEAAKQESSKATEYAAKIVQAHAQADAELTAAKEARGRADAHELSAKRSDDTLKGMATIAAENETRVASYEAELRELIKDATEKSTALLGQIRGLLPEATSTGLAAAFEARKLAVKQSQPMWQWVFILSLGGLLLVAAMAAGFIPGFPLPTTGDWHDLGVQVARRLPLIIAPLWLALFASRQLKTYFRLEEDYAHKVTMSNSFEGYKRELLEIKETDTPLARHTAAVIQVLASPPVRLYDEKHGTDTPLGTAAESLSKIMESASGAVSEAANSVRKVVR